jgi:hypothetical protein
MCGGTIRSMVSATRRNLVVEREWRGSGRHRVVAVAMQIGRDHAKSRREPLDQRVPLRFRAERRVQQHNRQPGPCDHCHLSSSQSVVMSLLTAAAPR